MFYRYHVKADGQGFPVLPAVMRLTLGGHEYATGPGAFFYGVGITNDPAGDRYHVQGSLPFPTHFTDLTGDPAADPDGIFDPILGLALSLADSSGTALASTALPLTAPNLAAFASAVGFLFIADGNGGPDFAVAEFRITSLEAVPEPSLLGLLGATCGLAGAGGRSRRAVVVRGR